MLETLDEQLATYESLSDKMDIFERRITDLAASDSYRENVEKLSCFIGIRTYSALAILVDTEDFERFPIAEKYAVYLGLVPGERTSKVKVRAIYVNNLVDTKVIHALRRLELPANH